MSTTSSPTTSSPTTSSPTTSPPTTDSPTTSPSSTSTGLKSYHLDGNILEVGVDETGRGSLISRVYTGAVIWDPLMTNPLIKDSKLLNHRQRLIAVDFIKENCPAWGLGWAEVEEIDSVNILQASMNAMHKAIDACKIAPQHVLVDGTYFKVYTDNCGNSVSHTTIPKGDNTFYSIAAASILAKVERDNFIDKLCDQYPALDVYELRSNKGYGSAKHEAAMNHWGVTRFHRKSFKTYDKYAKIFNNLN
jgi:ribonuclease HII